MNTRRAFTLIELLVVIAIIAILAAMIMPVISRARNQAGKVTDLNNLRQIIVATHLYAQDESDVLPLPNWDGGGPLADGKFHAGWLYTIDPSLSGKERYRLDKGLLWPTLHSPKVYVCPIDRLEKEGFSKFLNTEMQRPQQISTYAMNGGVIGYMYGFNHPEKPPVRLASLNPDDCAYWETDESDPFYFNDGANYPPEGVSARHTQGGIQVTFSGTVNYVRFADWQVEMAFPGRNRLWCYPGSSDGGDPDYGHNSP